MRYFFHTRAFLPNTQEQTIYPTILDFHLGANQSYIFRFSRKPRVAAGAFWSLTAYEDLGSGTDLIPNPLNRYSLGDRSNLTYPDGKRLSEGPDGPFDILIQLSDIELPLNWTNNWLPV